MNVGTESFWDTFENNSFHEVPVRAIRIPSLKLPLPFFSCSFTTAAGVFFSPAHIRGGLTAESKKEDANV